MPTPLPPLDLYGAPPGDAAPIPYRAHLRVDTGTHADAIRQIEVAADGRTLVSAGRSTLRVWDAGTRSLVRRLLGQVGPHGPGSGQGEVRRFALSPEGRWAVVLKEWPGPSTELQVFELATGNLQARFEQPGCWTDLAFTPDGRWLAIVGRAGRSELRMHATRRVLRAGFRGAPAPEAVLVLPAMAADTMLALRFVPDPRRRRRSVAVVAGATGLAWAAFAPDQGWSLRRRQPLDAPVDPATLAVSEALVVVGTRVRTARRGRLRWFAHEGAAAGELVTEAGVAAAAFSPSGRHLLAGLVTDAVAGGIAAAGDLTVAAHAYAAGALGLTPHSTYLGHDSTVAAVAFLGDEIAVSAGGDEQAIHAWRFAHRIGEPLWAIRGVGRTVVLPRVTAADQLQFGTVPLRLQPQRFPDRQQSFDLRRRRLDTTASGGARRRARGSSRWLIFDEGSQVIPLRHDAPEADPEAPLPPPDLTLFVGADDEWVLWTRSGYFDASPEGARRIGYHVDRGTDREALFVPADRFKPAYRPDLVDAVLRHGSEDRARARGIAIPPLAVAAMLPPIVELLPGGVAAGADEVRFTFRVENLCPAHPVTRVWILRNERLVWADARPSRRTRSRWTVTLQLVPGPNSFSLHAESGEARSVPVVQRVPGPAAGLVDENARGQLYLLSVGVSDFAVAGTPEAGDKQRLRFPHRDAAAIHRAFAQRNRAFDEVDARLLVDAQATRAAILRELESLCDQIQQRAARPGAERDLLMVFLSGHGVRYRGEPDLYFWCHDLRPAAMESTGLPLMTLGALITSVPAEVVLVVDACHAGMAGGNLVGGLDPEELARRIHAVNERGLYVLGAARSEQEAFEDGVGGQGVFTSALLASLPRRRGQRLSMMGLITGLQQRVPEISSRAGERPQTPVCRTYGELLPLTVFEA